MSDYNVRNDLLQGVQEVVNSTNFSAV